MMSQASCGAKSDRFPVLVYGQLTDVSDRPGWWLFWYDSNAADVRRRFIDRAKVDRVLAEAEARRYLQSL